MRRPRWHDVLIVLAIAGIGASGVWAFWEQDLRRALGWGGQEEVVEKAPAGV